VLAKAHGDTHLIVANAYLARGQLRAQLDQHALSVADLERAIAAFSRHDAEVDPGHLASAEWMLGRELYRADAPRARALVERAATVLATASPEWATTHAEAVAWLARHR
jgi:hypothetical protein